MGGRLGPGIIRLCAIVVAMSALSTGVAVGDSTGRKAGPERLQTRPELRLYSCLHASQAYTGFAEPAIRFRLKSGGVWIDRTFAEPKRARWTFRRGITTLFTKKGTRLERFAHFRDSSGKYLVEEPRGSDPLICR